MNRSQDYSLNSLHGFHRKSKNLETTANFGKSDYDDGIDNDSQSKHSISEDTADFARDTMPCQLLEETPYHDNEPQMKDEMFEGSGYISERSVRFVLKKKGQRTGSMIINK